MSTNNHESQHGRTYSSEQIGALMTSRTHSDSELLNGGAVHEGMRMVLTDEQVARIGSVGCEGLQIGEDREQDDLLIPRLFDPLGGDVQSAIARIEDQVVLTDRVESVTLPYGASMFDHLVPAASTNQRSKLTGRLKNKDSKIAKEESFGKQSNFGTIFYKVTARSRLSEDRNTLDSVRIKTGGDNSTALTYKESGALDTITVYGAMSDYAENLDNSVFNTTRRIGTDREITTNATGRFLEKVKKSGWRVDVNSVRIVLGDKIKLLAGFCPPEQKESGMFLTEAALGYNPLTDKFETTGPEEHIGVNVEDMLTILKELLETVPIQD